jgi:aminopeptidase N
LFRIYRDGGDTNETIHRPLYEFKDWLEYDSLVYGKGAIMFHELRQEMGGRNILQGFKGIFRKQQVPERKT